MNISRLTVPVLLCLLCMAPKGDVILSASHNIGEEQMDDQKAIESAISEFINAYNAGDITKVLAYYADDLIKLRNGAAPETKPEIARRLVDVFAKFRSRVDVVNDEIQTAGEMAFTRGSLRVTLTPKAGGDPQIIERRYLEVWRKYRGRWQVLRTMDNVDR